MRFKHMLTNFPSCLTANMTSPFGRRKNQINMNILPRLCMNPLCSGDENLDDLLKSEFTYIYLK